MSFNIEIDKIFDVIIDTYKNEYPSYINSKMASYLILNDYLNILYKKQFDSIPDKIDFLTISFNIWNELSKEEKNQLNEIVNRIRIKS